MVYKNLLIRFFSSFIIILIYLFTINNINYLFILGVIFYIIIFIEIYKYFKKYFYIVLFYFFISFISYIYYINYFYNFYLFNTLILTIIIFDTFSYLSGYYFGRNYPFKKISPYKTFEGYLGGIIFTNLLLMLYNFYLVKYSYNNLILINLIILTSIIGDLLQSFFKRINSIKDSSNFLPGHGGFFDRFDSFISSIILILSYSYLIQ